ncbi:hypothetical protein F5887DRAFT_362944 [Amanita rubescens]|nr:hypothetical protein F5887DRAFT_362944 [Amanita rubescens]
MTIICNKCQMSTLNTPARFQIDQDPPHVAKELHYLLKPLVFVKKRLDGEMNHQGPPLPALRLHRRVFFSHRVSENNSVQDINTTGLPHGPRQSAPPPRVDSEAIRRRPRSVSRPRYTDGTGRERTLSTDYSGSGSGYSQAQAHTPTDVPMDVDVDSLPSSSSRVPPTPLPDLSNDLAHKLPNRTPVPDTAASASSSDAFVVYPGDEKRRDRIGVTEQSPGSRQDFLPRNQRAIYDGTDRHVPRRETRNHTNDIHRPGPTGFTPRLTGPNSVPIGARRQDTGSRLPDVVPHPPESPIRNPKPLPPLPPGKESYERPVYDAKAAVDSYRAPQHDNAGTHQRRQRDSPPPHKRDYPSPSPTTANIKDIRRDPHPRERSRFDQPLREGRVPQSYERPAPETQARAAPPPLPREPTPSKQIPVPDRSHQPTRSVDEPQSPRAKLLAAKEKIDQQHRLRKEELHQAEGFRQSKPSPTPTQESQDKSIAEDRLRNLRLQEHHPDDRQPPRPPSPQLLPAKGREDARPSLLKRRPGLPDAQADHPVSHGSAEQWDRREGHATRFDNAHDTRHEVQKNIHPISLSNVVVPAKRNSHEPHRPERPPPSHTALVNAALSAERRTRWGAPVSAVGPERSDNQRPGPIDKYEPTPAENSSGPPPRRRPQLRLAKDDPQLGESSRAHEVPTGPPPRAEYEKAPPTSRRLLDRLSLDPAMPTNDQSLWDRVQKRDRNEVDHPMDAYEAEAMSGAGEPAVKRPRRRSNKPRRNRRGGAPP